MILSVLQENLLKALVKTSRVVPIRPQLPVLQNVFINAHNGRITVSATNLETTEAVHVGAKIEKEGSLCVSSRTLTEFVSSLPQEAIHITEKEQTLHLSCAGFRAIIPGVAASEFPSISQIEKKTESKLKKDVLAGALPLVLFAAATDEGRPLLTGIKVKSEEKHITLAATDGYRLSVKQAPLVTKEPLDLVVPARALAEVAKASLEEKEEEEVIFGQTPDGQLVFLCGDTEITTRLIDGEYPNFEKIIPTTHNTRMLIEKQALLRAVKSAAIFARDNANIIRFHLENQRVTVSANTPQVGENKVEMEAKIDGEGGDIAFNSRFLTEFLTNYPEEELLFEMTGSLNPGVFKPVKDDSFLHIIMPVRVQG